MSLKNPKILKKMLRKSPASNTWAAICKDADFSVNSLKVTKLTKYQHFSSLKFSSVFIINISTVIFDVSCEVGHTCQYISWKMRFIVSE